MTRFQRTHSDDFRAACVREYLDNPKTTYRQIVEMAARGDLREGMPPAKVDKGTIANWVKVARVDRDTVNATTNAPSAAADIAAVAMVTAKEEIDLMRAASKRAKDEREPVDAQRLRALLGVVKDAAKMLANAGLGD